MIKPMMPQDTIKKEPKKEPVKNEEPVSQEPKKEVAKGKYCPYCGQLLPVK
jgi:hypothetical protein